MLHRLDLGRCLVPKCAGRLYATNLYTDAGRPIVQCAKCEAEFRIEVKAIEPRVRSLITVPSVESPPTLDPAFAPPDPLPADTEMFIPSVASQAAELFADPPQAAWPEHELCRDQPDDLGSAVAEDDAFAPVEATWPESEDPAIEKPAADAEETALP